MCVRRSSWESVTLREELVGRLREGSRLPQYLLYAVLVILNPQRIVDEKGLGVLYHGNVYWSRRAGSVDFCHVS